LYDNKDIIMDEGINTSALECMNENRLSVEKRRKSIKKWMAKRTKVRTSPFTVFSRYSTLGSSKDDLVSSITFVKTPFMIDSFTD